MRMTRNEDYAGRPLQLSPREAEVLRWTACGKTSGEISRLLSITEDTVNTHIKSACLKLDAVNKTHATAIALSHGVIQIGPSPDLVIPLSTLLGLSRQSPDPRAVASVSLPAPRQFVPKKHGRRHD
ncbi:MAG: helix-turn-helix domain-containing protein [Alphaproteobacteria bacterium]|nr:helix-turn-helix domain-containing protein [Alphaproteobacteria bacterium]